MAFSAKKYLESIELPTFIAEDGTKIVGERITVNQALEVRERLYSPELNTDNIGALVTDVCTMCKMEAAIPHILALPWSGQKECLDDFFASLKGRKIAQE